LRDHTARLFRSARIFAMKIPFTADELFEAQRACVRDNRLDSCYIRPIAFYGSVAMGVAAKSNPVRVAIAAWPWGAYLGADGLEKGIRVKTSSFTHHHPNITMCGAKSVANYSVSILANQEASHDGYEEAMLLDPQGYICQGSGENVFIVRDGVLTTPPIAAGCLDGITRTSVMQIARDAGYTVKEENLVRSDLYFADEAFFTGTAAEVTPIREVDDRKVGEGTRGPVTKEIQGTFFSAARGEVERYASWLTYVND
jgi:branched-chain amino acid aminotransferase